MLDVSIVIVNWNARAILLECLDSIRRLPDKASREVIVVDNASSDGSPAAVAAAFPGIRLIETGANLGFAAGNNVGILSSQGRYVFLVNSDAIVLPRALDALVALLDAAPEVAIAGPQVLNVDRTLQVSCRNAPGPWRLFCQALGLDRFPRLWKWFPGEMLYHSPHAEQSDVEAISGCFVAVRRKAIDQVGLLDERFFMYAEDVDWCMRFRAAGWRIRFTPDASIVHLGGVSSGLAPARFSVEQERSLLRLWEKHYGRLGRTYYGLVQLLYAALRLAPQLVLYVCLPSRRDRHRSKIRQHFNCLLWLMSHSEPWNPRYLCPRWDAGPIIES